MTERDDPNQVHAPEMRIPDGGLSTSMPSWLNQPPAWKRQPVKVEAPARTLPPPDESIIDPATMLTDDDLPAWLRTMARGLEDQPTAEPDPPSADPGTPQPEPAREESDSKSDDDIDVTPDQSVTATADSMHQAPSAVEPETISQPAVAADSLPRDRDDVASPAERPRNETPWWLSEQALVSLLLLMLLAMVYVVLAATGVV